MNEIDGILARNDQDNSNRKHWFKKEKMQEKKVQIIGLYTQYRF